MLDIINKLEASYEKHAGNLLEDMIKVAQPFTIYVVIDPSWNGLIDGIMVIDSEVENNQVMDIYIDAKTIINSYVEKKDKLFFTFIFEDENIIGDDKKLKISIPIDKIITISIDDGVGSHFINKPTFTSSYTLDTSTIEEFKNI